MTTCLVWTDSTYIFIKNNKFTNRLEHSFLKLHFGAVSTLGYFVTAWKSCCGNIKNWKVRTFSKYGLCEAPKQSLGVSITNSASSISTKLMKAAYNWMLAQNKKEHYLKTDLAASGPVSFLSIIVNVVEQSPFGLPHLVTELTAKNEGRWKLKGLRSFTALFPIICTASQWRRSTKRSESDFRSSTHIPKE